MKKYCFFVVLPLLLLGCTAAPASYDSFSHRESDFNISNITISEKGLSQEQISSILATRFPPGKTVSIAVIFLQNYRSYNSNNSGLAYYIMNQGKNINGVEKFVPIPRIFIPRNVTFDTIQDLGIRSLCEYTLLFYNNTGRTMTFSQLLSGDYKFESDMEFSIIDNQTTAIIASDRLYSSVIRKRADMEEAESEVYTLQAELFAEKMNLLFRNQ